MAKDELHILRLDIENYQKNVFMDDALNATNDAKYKLRDHIARTHPQRVRGNPSKDSYYKVSKNRRYVNPYYVEGRGVVVPFMIFADYFSRWYNTGAFGRTIKKRGSVRLGMRGPSYGSQGDFFGTHYDALQKVARDVVVERLQRSVKDHI